MHIWRIEVWTEAGKIVGYRVVCGQGDTLQIALNGNFRIDVFYVAEPFYKAKALAYSLNAETTERVCDVPG